MKKVKVSKSVLTAAGLLANAYIAGRSGDAKKAGAFMVAACRTDDLDAIMHGVATACGIDEDDYIEEDELYACDEEDCEDCDTEEDEELLAEDEEEDDTLGEVYEDEEEEDTEEPEEEDEEPEVPVTASLRRKAGMKASTKKIAIPASCARLARIRY